MPKECYVEKVFSNDHELVINQANAIIADYQAQGFRLTLRQLYYQFVSKDLIPNNVKAYKRLGGIINDARLAGLIDWNAIEDRTRNTETLSSWSSPAAILKAVASQFRYDRWRTQEVRKVVRVEKEALIGVIQPVCEKYRVPFTACRGYTSQSEAWETAKQFSEWHEEFGQDVEVLYLGDHDPSGIDMTRDNRERLEMFTSSLGEFVTIDRLALNMDQIRRYRPPPNPAKFTDSRAEDYVAKFGNSSWELDALSPTVIADLIEESIRAGIDWDEWEAAEAREEKARERLLEVSKNWKD